VHFVGNVMIDTLMANKAKAQKSDVLERLGLRVKEYAVITLHRPSNVDDVKTFGEIITAFEGIAKEMKLVFPIHPRTRDNIKDSELERRMEGLSNLMLLEPVGYLDFLCLMSSSALVLTDSGGIQEETTILGVPCMTLRESTERPVTITEGTNRLVHVTAGDILANYREIRDGGVGSGYIIPKLWDGKAAERIARIITES
jgi:UDP-N-acetylglucosamine 2-epimerase (non-hydrolysing)